MYEEACPVEKGFQLLSTDGPCVKFHADHKSWYDANQMCASYSRYGRLVVVDTKQKDDLVIAAGKADNTLSKFMPFKATSEFIVHVFIICTIVLLLLLFFVLFLGFFLFWFRSCRSSQIGISNTSRIRH